LGRYRYGSGRDTCCISKIKNSHSHKLRELPLGISWRVGSSSNAPCPETPGEVVFCRAKSPSTKEIKTMAKKYTITSAGSKKDSPDLVGCKIEQQDDGTWEFKSGSTKLASGSSPSFSFDNFDGFNWTITTTSESDTQLSGTWTNTDQNDVSPTEESDNWVATATTTPDEDEGEDEARAASAKY
jgi:hypothetical protein